MKSDGTACRIAVPGDKSITHRCLILAALADGTSRIRAPLDALDTRATAQALRGLGTRIPPLHAAEIRVEGLGLHGLRPATGPLDCANSGTTARMLLGVLAGCEFRSIVTGDASLLARPMRRVTEPLEAAGATIEELGHADRLPVAVRGRRLRPIRHDAAHASAQVKSALLLAGLTGGAPVRTSEPHRSRDHTERLLASAGASIETANIAGRNVVSLGETASLGPLDLKVPGDFSSAAFFLAWGALGGEVRIEGVGINPTRTGLLDALARMGADVRLDGTRNEDGEPVADLIARPSRLRGTAVRGEETVRMIDEIPALAVLAARAEGETRIEGATELRVKESDRIRALIDNLRAVGVSCEERPDGLVVQGAAGPLRGFVRCGGDHRIAMAFAILGALPDNEIRVDEPECAAVSFPGFWDRLAECSRADSR